MKQTLATLVAATMSCTSAAPGVARQPRPRRCEASEAVSFDDVSFATSPGGAPEVTVDWLSENRCKVRLIDVRETSELLESGSIEGAEHVPIAALSQEASDWNPREPVVVLCRSGRRSARAVATLESLGFDRVASLTGGLLSWQLADQPMVAVPTRPPPPMAARVDGPISVESLEEALAAAPPRPVRAATLLLHGTESCVDGREDHAVLGTPGGDAGELLLALSTIESLVNEQRAASASDQPFVLEDGAIVALFDAYVQSFGRVYFHSDEHAMQHLRRALRDDPRFQGAPLGATASDLEAFLRRPPAALREPLLEHLLEPSHVGCGHLRLVLQNPEQYGVRAGLSRALGRVVHQMLWTRPELVDFVVLHGDHQEEAVVNVVLDGAVHAFSNVPAISPRLGGHSVFLNHPQVAAFVREQHARFLFQEVPALRAHGITEERFEAALAERAGRQLDATLGHLAPRLPVFELRFENGRARVSRTR
ncbi:MAG: rhodanese-like domain-containing protein [Myxococcales bacterium]|nr:rhodanese-like domain-containing protein [Myxococcales bacterium]